MTPPTTAGRDRRKQTPDIPAQRLWQGDVASRPKRSRAMGMAHNPPKPERSPYHSALCRKHFSFCQGAIRPQPRMLCPHPTLCALPVPYPHSIPFTCALQVHVPLTKATRQSKGTAFVQFVSDESAKAAKEALHEGIFQGRLLNVQFAKPQPGMAELSCKVMPYHPMPALPCPTLPFPSLCCPVLRCQPLLCHAMPYPALARLRAGANKKCFSHTCTSQRERSKVRNPFGLRGKAS